MTSSREARALACALGMGLVTTSAEVWAEEATTPAAERSAREPPRSGSVRMDLGIGAMGGLGATSGLGGVVPVGTAALEVLLAGPAWLVVTGRGGYWRTEGEREASATSSAVGLRVGPRFEWPVVDRFDAGFHALASVGHSQVDVEEGTDLDVLDVGGVAGASIHARVSRVFGVRVVTDVVRGGWANASPTGGSAGYVLLDPAPSAELTFTF